MTKPAQEEFGPINEMMRHYRIPTLVVTLGIGISVIGFVTGLKSNMHALEQDFHNNAEVENTIFAHTLNSYFRGMELTQSFTYSSDVFTQRAFDIFTAPLFRRGKFSALFFIPYNAANPDYLVPSRYSINSSQSLTVRPDLGSYPEIVTAAAQAVKSRKPIISRAFALSASDPEKRHVALVFPLYKSGGLKGFDIGFMDLKRLATDELGWPEHADTTFAYIFDVTDPAKPLLVAVDQNGVHPDTKSKEASSAEYLSLGNYPPFHSQYKSDVLNRQWEIFYIPTAAYLAQAAYLLPWIILAAGLLVTVSLGIACFQLASRNVEVSKRVLEGTRLYRQIAAQLMESENKLRAMVDNALDGFITIDERGLVESFNAACEHIFGYKGAEVIGQNIKMLMPEPYHSEHDGYLSRYVTTHEARIIGTAGREVRGRRRDGNIFPMDLSVSAFQLKDGRHFSGIIRDITQRKDAENEHKKLVDRLTQSNEELGRFAYVASHDLKEPLRMVTNFTGLLEKKYGNTLDEKAREYIRFAREGGERMHTLVDDLLEYARTGTQDERLEDVDCNHILGIVKENLAVQIAENAARITYGPLPVIRANAVRMAMLLQNLINNGIKYQEKHATAEIMVDCEDKSDVWQFSVKDNGIGIKAEYLSKIFEPFKRLHTKENYRGTGIGLAISLKIVENWGGKIWAASQPGKGTTIYFTIPKNIF